ncbi:MAG: amidohydrolase family protein [Armatimonadota bacterium]|nr:amidohydrolase family protein [Armatimonadota bacterium]
MSRLIPGLVDIHVHGVAGLDVMNGEANQIVVELRNRGIEWCCPTTVTASNEDLQRALGAVDPSTPGFAGIHLEGPFISPNRPGAQTPSEIRRRAATNDYRELVRDFGDLIRIVTLAPEVPGCPELARLLSEQGVIVSAGHTDATFEQLQYCPGIEHMTHFYNAMSPLDHRKPGAVGFGLTQPVRCELIYDRIHVAQPAARVLFQAKEPDSVIAISDGTAASGMPDGWAGVMWGQNVVKREGSVRLSDGTLAGSAVTLADVFKFLWQDFGAEIAISACSTSPRKALGLPEPQMWLQVDEQGTIIEVLDHR